MAQVLWHSYTTKEFVKEFHKLYKQLAKPLDLMLSYRAGDQDTNALLQLQHDLLILSYVLIDHWCATSKGKWLTNSNGEERMDRTCFLFELAEFTIRPLDFKVQSFFEEEKRPHCGLALEQHVSHYIEQRKKEKQTHVHGATLEMLREYDKVKNTNLSSLWKNFLQKIVEKAFLPEPDYIMFPPPNHKEEKLKALPLDEQELRIRLLETYEHAAQGGRASGFLHPLGQDMSQSITKFVDVANQGWRTVQNRDPRSRLIDLQSTFSEEALEIASIVMNLEGEPNTQATQLLWDIAPSLSLYGYSQAELAELAEQFRRLKVPYERINDMPETVNKMELVQQLTKGNEGRLAKHLFFNLAVCFCKADGVVSPSEEKLLNTFANTLFGNNQSVTVDMGLFAPAKPSFEPTTHRFNEDTSKKKNELKPDKDSMPTLNPKEPSQEAAPPVMGEPLSTDRSIAELHELVGLEQVKADVQYLVNFTRIQQVRSSRGMKTAPAARHMLFYGNPGTGKTTVARLIAQIYRALGVVSKGHLVECDRAALIGAFAGQTAIKVSEVVSTAVGGVLFIDEAYSLNQGDKDSYGLEAIDTLVKLMEDNRDDLVVIAAGYPEKMAAFISTNPGLRSRFNRVFNFDDYNPEQLLAIFLGLAKSAGYQVAPDASDYLAQLFEHMHKTRDETFGNGREVRNVFEAVMSEQANRLVTQADVSVDALSQITLEDATKLTEAVQFQKSKPPAAFGFQPTKS